LAVAVDIGVAVEAFGEDALLRSSLGRMARARAIFVARQILARHFCACHEAITADDHIN
jgi:hypothetical protein